MYEKEIDRWKNDTDRFYLCKGERVFQGKWKVLAERETTDYIELLDRYEAQERKQLEDSGVIKLQRIVSVKKNGKR